MTLPKDYKIPSPLPNIEIKTDKTDLTNSGIMMVPLNVRRAGDAARGLGEYGRSRPQLVGKPAPLVSLKNTAGQNVTIGGKGDW